MTNDNSLLSNISEDELANQQTLKYGQDLARIYVAEKAKREKLEVAYQALNAIFSSTPDGLAVLDNSLMIQQANTAFGQLVEQNPRALVGFPIGEILPVPELISVLQVPEVVRSGPIQVEFAVTKPVRRSLLANIARLQSGHLSGWVIVLHDQSARKRLDYQKSEFINIVAHELRTPLASIIGYTELLREDFGDSGTALNDLQRQYFEALSHGGRRLSNIITEILQFAHLNQGSALASGQSEFLIVELIEDVLADLRPLAAEKSVDLQPMIPDPTIRMLADSKLLRSTVYQLVLNGINFNKPGGYVRIRAAQIEDKLLLDVADSGIGIPRGDLQSIFLPFFQVQDHNTRQIGGLGLGLSIVRQAVNELSGELTLDSVLEEGTTFHLQFPIRQEAITDTKVAELEQQLEVSQQQSLVYARDLQRLYTHLQDTYHDLQDVAVQLEEANKLKAGFLDAISHELRSPFVPIDFALQAFPRYGLDNLTEEQRGLLEQLKENTQDARQKINNLVSYAALVKKQGRLKRTPLDMPTLIAEAVTLHQAKADLREINLHTQVPDKLVLPAGDKERIGDAIWHLLDNAIKFTSPGGEVTLRAREEKGYIVIEVQDTGIGVPVERQKEVWDSFGRMRDGLRRGLEGLGLGLSLVRYVAAAHGGDVLLESEPGVGSVFGFWLPVGSRGSA